MFDKKFYLLILLCVFFITVFVSCRKGETTEINSESRGTYESSINYDGRERTFHISIPSSYDGETPVPLVIAIHGGGGLSIFMLRETGFSDLAEEEGFIVLYPQGVDKQWNDGRPLKTTAYEENIDDVGFISALIDHVSSIFNIDKNCVYATGISNGGFMSFRLAYELSDKIAAVAPVTATLSDALYNEFPPPENPVSILIMNGTDDPLVPWNGGYVTILNQKRGKILSTEDTVNFFIEHNKCSEEPVTREMEDIDPDDDVTAEEIIYSGPGGVEVVLYKINGGGHTWPDGKQYLPKSVIGTVCRDLNGTKVIWNFFKRHEKSK